MPRPKAEVAAEAARIKSIDTKEEEEALDEEDPAIKMEEALLKAFKTVDEDKSGELDRAEVKFLIELMGSTIDGPELDAAMLELDTGGDGMVSFEEFKTYWNNNFTTGGTMLAGLIRRFASMPPVTNASGAVLAHHEGRYIDEDEIFRARVHSMFGRIKGGDPDRVTAGEFFDFVQSFAPGQPGTLSSFRTQIRKFDSCGNNSIDCDELAGVIKAMGLQKIVPSVNETALYQIQKNSRRIRERKRKNPQLYKNPVWAHSFEIPGCEGLSDDQMDKFKEVFSMADIEHMGYLGRRQFKDLLNILSLEPDPGTLEQMFVEMDDNADGQIEFTEFVLAMVNNIGIEALDSIQEIQMGTMGTRRWTRGDVLWAANNGLLITTVGIMLLALVYFRFILIPLTTSFFFTFLLSPIMDMMEFRPILCVGKTVCDNMEWDPMDPKGEKRFKKKSRRDMMGSKATCHDLFVYGACPHGLALLMTLVLVFTGFIVLVMMIYDEVEKLTSDKEFMQALDDFVESMYSKLNSSGIKVIRDDGPPGYTKDELGAIFNRVMGFFNQAALVFLLTLYIMSEKINRTLFPANNKILMEIERQVKGYIALKTAISSMTGFLVAIILLALSVKLAVMFGLLSFLLNFIPNVGSMIAMVLPFPIVIVDANLKSWQKAGAFIGPGIVQGYVGNALEPVLFGKSLNMTPLSILAALVIWGSIWGLTGAILSVPLLAVQKVLLSHTNHPMAKYCIQLVREDATIDENDFHGA